MIVFASPRTPTVSKTRSPVALVTLTVGVIVLLPALTKVPRGVTWSTSENDAAPAPKIAAALIVTVTVAVPVLGAMSLQISIRVCVAWPFWAPTNDSVCAPKVMPETVVPVLIETPTRSSRFGPAPTVWLQARVLEATVLKELVAASAAMAGVMPRNTELAGAPGRPGRKMLVRSDVWPIRAAGRARRRRIARHPADRRAHAVREKRVAGFK